MIQFCIDNQALILGLLFAISEALGANPRVKSNGFFSAILIGIQSLKRRE